MGKTGRRIGRLVSAVDLRAEAARSRDANATRRMLALALVLEGTAVAGISGMDALIPTPIRFHAIRTDFGRPNSSIRFRAFAAMAASVA